VFVAHQRRWWIHIGIGPFRITAIHRRVGDRIPGLVVAVGYFLFVAQPARRCWSSWPTGSG
jgi:hypothetical protein